MHREDHTSRPPITLAITVGDPGGIGPEICLKALNRLSTAERSRVRLHGAQDALEKQAQALGLRAVLSDCQLLPTTTNPNSPPGQYNASTGQSAFEAIQAASEDCLKGQADAMVTGPIQKEALQMAGHAWPGHTELLAHLCRGEAAQRDLDVRMMLATRDLRVVLDSIHVSMRTMLEQLHATHLLDTIRTAHTAGPLLGLQQPRIAIAALNPHASENGLFGREEAEILTPAIAAATREGILATGPWPADTLFQAAMGARPQDRQHDLVVCLYHDQGLIPIKRDGIDQGVNITLGLPIIRTSVDHGTAMAIAGQNLASEASLLEAIRMAQQFCHSRQITQ